MFSYFNILKRKTFSVILNELFDTENWPWKFWRMNRSLDAISYGSEILTYLPWFDSITFKFKLWAEIILKNLRFKSLLRKLIFLSLKMKIKSAKQINPEQGFEPHIFEYNFRPQFEFSRKVRVDGIKFRQPSKRNRTLLLTLLYINLVFAST